ncbi:MAG: glycosyltransferase, partial [Acidobacteriota bacterium]
MSVLIVSHNSAAALRRSLAALERSGEREKFEVLVIDNASRDESPQLDTEFPSATFLRLPRHFGLVKALNIGMRTAKGEFFLFLAVEAEVLADTVPALAARLAGAPEAVAVCPLVVTPEDQPRPRLFQLPTPDAVASLARRGAWLESGQRELEGDSVPVPFPSMAALMVRSYFLKGLRYIDERYG